MKQYRQGDIFLRQIEDPKLKTNPTRFGCNVALAEGKVTGASHRVVSTGVISLYDQSERITYMHLSATGKLEHTSTFRDHGTIPLEKEWWEVRRQRELHAHEIRTVID